MKMWCSIVENWLFGFEDWLRGSDMDEKVIELSHIEINEFCLLNLKTGEKVYYDKKKYHFFTGLYYRENTLFFALYPTENGPMIYFEGKEYPLNRKLHIYIHKDKEDKMREFHIDEYNISVNYKTSKYIGFDAWSQEDDVDLFYHIEQNYKNDDYYKKYTRKIIYE